jgi:hypothetical protein
MAEVGHGAETRQIAHRFLLEKAEHKQTILKPSMLQVRNDEEEVFLDESRTTALTFRAADY